MISTLEKLSESDFLRIIQEKDLCIQTLRWELAQLKRMIFAAKSERFAPVELPGQLSMEMNVAQGTEGVKETTVTVEAHRRRTKKEEPKAPFRNPFPAHLPREIVEIRPEGDLRGCTEISREITEVLELTEAKLFVKRYERIKYAKPQEEGVLIGSLPSRIIEKGLFGQSLLTQIILDKYADHLPIYRQMQRFDREGVKIAYSTLADVPRQISQALYPLYELLVKEVMGSGYLQADETPTPVLDRDKKGKTHRGFYWVYRSPEKRLILFDYRQGRGRDGPAQMLSEFEGFLQTDGYAVYDDFEKRKEITLAGCMAHARRYFQKAMDSDPARAAFVIKEMQKLYEAEKIIRDENKSSGEILGLRKELSRPVLQDLETWLKEQLVQVTPKSPMGQAIAYSLARWGKLIRYLDHPQLEIDNNLVENAIRPSVIGRKNYLFAGSHEGARRSAMFYSFLGSCRENKINPQHWLRDVISIIMDTKTSRLHTLLPSSWKPR